MWKKVRTVSFRRLINTGRPSSSDGGSSSIASPYSCLYLFAFRVEPCPMQAPFIVARYAGKAELLVKMADAVRTHQSGVAQMLHSAQQFPRRSSSRRYRMDLW